MTKHVEHSYSGIEINRGINKLNNQLSYLFTFIFHLILLNIFPFIRGETHTLGNALRNVILQNPNVIFCGYDMPHPAEDQMFLRIQTVEGVSAQDALRKGLKDLKGICKVTKEKFEKAVQDFNNKQN